MTQRLAEALIRALNLIGKTSIFSESSHLYDVTPDESTDWKATDGKLHRNPSGKTMILLCFCPVLLPPDA